jgi:hypothetical protein
MCRNFNQIRKDAVSNIKAADVHINHVATVQYLSRLQFPHITKLIVGTTKECAGAPTLNVCVFSRMISSIAEVRLCIVIIVIQRLAYLVAGLPLSVDSASPFNNSFMLMFPSSVCIAPGIGGSPGHLSFVKTECLINSICYINSATLATHFPKRSATW